MVNPFEKYVKLYLAKNAENTTANVNPGINPGINPVNTTYEAIRNNLCLIIPKFKEIINPEPPNGIPEVGCYICSNGKDIKTSPISKGRYAEITEEYDGEEIVDYEPFVDIDSKCPPGYKPIASIHTHPLYEGEPPEYSLLPSMPDIEATGPNGENLVKCIVGTEDDIDGKGVCWKIPDDKFDQVYGELERKNFDVEEIIEQANKATFYDEKSARDFADYANKKVRELNDMVKDMLDKYGVYIDCSNISNR